jgi:hypothetical protein
MAEGGQASRSRQQAITPMVVGQRFGHDASTGVSITDEKNTFSHNALHEGRQGLQLLKKILTKRKQRQKISER